MRIQPPRGFARGVVGFFAVCLLVVSPAYSRQAKAPQNADALVKSLNDQAAQGQLTPQTAQDALAQAGITGAQQDQIMQQLLDKQQQFLDAKNKADNEKAAKEQAAKDAKAQADQNASGTADWNFGQVYRDRDYKVTMPLTNACKVNQTVTLTYPTTINLQGPETVDVPAKSTVDVPMNLIMTQPPLPVGPFPPGFTMNCYDIKGDLHLVHPELERVTKTASGTETYICHKMERTYTVKAHVHLHGPPDPPQGGGGGKGKGGKGGGGQGGGGGGGGGTGGRGDSSTCDIYWNHREFYPNGVYHNPEQCIDGIRSDAHEYFGQALAPFEAKNPAAWAWTPDSVAIDQMTVAQLMDAKARADAQAKAMP